MASIHVDEGRLVLSFHWRGAQYRQYTKHPDTKEGQAAAKRLARPQDARREGVCQAHARSPALDKVLGHRRINNGAGRASAHAGPRRRERLAHHQPRPHGENRRVVKSDIDPLSLQEVEALLTKGFTELRTSRWSP